MPTYTYECEKCKKAYEIVQKITEEPVKRCPKCESEDFKRVIGVPTFILKKGPWH